MYNYSSMRERIVSSSVFVNKENESMKLVQFITVSPVLALLACAPMTYAEETGPYPEKHYKYSNIRTQIDHIFIINDDDMKIASLSDVDLSATIQDDASGALPIILAFDRPYNVVFYLPGEFDSNVKNWSYKSCNFEVVGRRWGFRPSADRVVHEYLIQQECEGDPKVVRYEYADYFGLQSFGIGELKPSSDEELAFYVEDVYALYGAEIGFGARP